MKNLLILFLATLSWFSSFGQTSIEQPLYWWVSKFPLENLQEMPVGAKILFQQDCNHDLPAEVPTGRLFFENVRYQKELFSMGIEFKDTIVVSVTYYLKPKQQEVLKAIGYPDIKAKGSAIKGQWTYTLQEDNRRTTIVGDKKRIVVVQTR